MAKRWYYTFKTQSGHTCDVVIDDHNFSGTAVELNKDVAGSPGCPADSPVVIEEDNSDDILDNYRIKTGYLRLVELTQGGLSDMYPATNTDYEVYISIDKPSNIPYDSILAVPYTVFRGWIQAQSFETDFLDYHDEIELPIQSPLGLLREEQIGTDETALSHIFEDNFQNYYKYLVFPLEEYTDYLNLHRYNMLDMTVAREILYPYNKDYNFGAVEVPTDPRPPVYTPITIEDFVKKICDARGMTAHDVGQYLIFTKLGYTGNYYRYDISDVDTDNGVVIGAGSDVNNMTSFLFAKDKNKISNVMPTHKLTQEWEEYTHPSVLNLTMSHYVSVPGVLVYDGYQIYSMIWDNTTSPWTNVVNGIRITPLVDKDSEALSVRANPIYYNSMLFSVEFPTPLLAGNLLYIEVDKDKIVTGTMQISVFSNGKYFNFSQQDEEDLWVDYEVFKTISITDSKCSVEIGTNGRRCTVKFYTDQSNRYQNVNWYITKMEVQDRYNTEAGRYAFDRSKIHEVVITYDNGSNEEKNVNIDFCKYNDGVLGAFRYQQLSISQRNLKLTLKRNFNISELQLLISKFAMSVNDQTNRVISTKYDVREDDITLQVMGNQYF